MTTAFVLSGGGSLGAVQVGMLRALAERQVTPDMLIGTSAGAMNAAFIAGAGFDLAAVERLADIWQSLRRRDLFPVGAMRAVRSLIGATPAIASDVGLRRLVADHLSYDRLEDAAIPLHVVTTDLLSGHEVVLSTGEAVGAIVASASVPALLPPVEREGRVLVDGGVADNAAISQAIGLGADHIVVLPTGYACALEHPPATALAAGLHALTLLIERRLIRDVAEVPSGLRLTVLPPLCPLGVSAADFTQARGLIERAHLASAMWMDSGNTQLPRPERFLSMHGHENPCVPSPTAADHASCR